MNREEVKQLKEMYPKGTRIVLHSMDDIYPVPRGTTGIVDHVDDMGQIHVIWDNGSSLALNIQKDNFTIIKIRQIICNDTSIETNVPMIRKGYLEPSKIFIHRALKLESIDFHYFLEHPLQDHDFIEQHLDVMYQDEDGTMNGVVYYTDDYPDGIFVESEGAKYARYQGYIPNIHNLLETGIVENVEESPRHPKIKVLVVEPQAKPFVAIIDNDYETLNHMVGGYLETVSLSDTAEIVCNEEGKIKNLPANRRLGNDVLAGRFIIVGVNDSEHFVSLSQKDIQKYSQQFGEIEKIDQSEVQRNMSYTIIGY